MSKLNNKKQEKESFFSGVCNNNFWFSIFDLENNSIMIRIYNDVFYKKDTTNKKE